MATSSLQPAHQKVPGWILPIIVIAQFCCTSLWFAGNGVMTDLMATFHFEANVLGDLTSAVQFGFIAGTLVFAFFSLADRFSPSKVFLISALFAAGANLATIYGGNTLGSLLVLRFFTGFFLAGIYPVGMKIASDYYQKELSKSLGFLVGALVLGTAFPHFLKGFTEGLPWRMVILSTTGLAILGGGLIGIFVPNGPFRKPGQAIKVTAFFKVFKDSSFLKAALGYFGHMWELYAFWAFVPVILSTYTALHPAVNWSIPILSFCVIGVGGLACMLAGLIARKWGPRKTASWALALSGICCLASPLFFLLNAPMLFIGFLIFWGATVIADSPLLSTLVAQYAPHETRGTALTIVNCLGFSITIVSIQLIAFLLDQFTPQNVFWVLAFGPILGLISLNLGKGKEA